MYQKVLVPLDGSELAECVLPHVQTIAGGCATQEVVLLRVVKPFYLAGSYVGNGVSAIDIARINDDAMNAAREYLQKVADGLKLANVKVQWEVTMGNEADSIADYAGQNNVDLIVIATHGRSGISRWVWGSVADRVLRSGCIPVLMIRAPGCVPGLK